MEHHYFADKIFFGTMALISAGLNIIGAMFAPHESQWLCVTMAVGSLVSACLALMTRRNESIRIIAGRCLFSVIVAVLGTRVLVRYFDALAIAGDDILLLGALAGTVTVVSFTIGFGFIRSLDDDKFSLGQWIKDMLLLILTRKNK